MTRSEFQELVGFLAPKLDAINRRLDAIETRVGAIETRVGAIETRLTRVEVGVEENRHQIQLLAEGITAVREEMAREFAAVRSEMADGFRIHGKLIQGLTARMDRWEGHPA